MNTENFTPDLQIAKNGQHWHALAAEEALERLQTFAEQGLTSKEAERRLHEFGPNQLKEAPPPTFWQMLWQCERC